MKKVTKKPVETKSSKASRPKAPTQPAGVIKLPKANDNDVIKKGLYW